MEQIKITLRQPQLIDAERYFYYLQDPDVTVWLEDRLQYPIGYGQIAEFVLGQAWARWAIEVDGLFVGLTGLEDYNPQTGTARFFFVIGDKSCWGKGVGQEVITQVKHHGFYKMGLRKITSNYYAPHKASQIIHDRAGFVVEGRLRQQAWRQGAWVDQILVSCFNHE